MRGAATAAGAACTTMLPTCRAHRRTAATTGSTPPQPPTAPSAPAVVTNMVHGRVLTPPHTAAPPPRAPAGVRVGPAAEFTRTDDFTPLHSVSRVNTHAHRLIHLDFNMHPISSYPDFKLSDLPKEAGDRDLFIYIIYIWICTLSSYPDFKLSEIFSSTASNTQGQTHPTGRQTLNGKGIPSPRKFLPETMNLHEGEVLPRTSKQADLDRSESQQELRCVRFGIWTIPLKGGCWPRVARPGLGPVSVVLKNE